ncbi:hypothetical protein MTR67_050246 [Solanum verrucosum]|uniref:Uncharacterized protein n=1 Tax=Solanum verrucosum TaxID=315347 RepID=A0AAF0V501_SOLVR|nr:hypothetical protein MTR67_050246 [Solanum verrucosum]
MAVSPVAGLNSKLSLPSGKQQHSKFTGQSVRAIPIRILTVGKNRSHGVQLIVDEYMKKLRNYCSVDDVRIKSNPKNARDVVAQIEHEDIAVMGLIRPDEWVVMLDERGHDVGSEQVASLIGDAGNKVSYASSWQSLLFLVSSIMVQREHQAYSFALVDLMDMVDNCERELTSETGTNYYSFEVLVLLTPPPVPHLCW